VDTGGDGPGARMSGAVLWRPGDSRSLRADRVPMDMRVLGRLVPLEPEEVDDTVGEWLPLADLALAVDELWPWLNQRVADLPQALRLSTGFYPHMAKLPFGEQRRDLLVPGMYVITDTGPSQRVLYVGSSVDNNVRSRLIAHLYADGRMYSAQRAFRYAFEQLGQRDYACEAEADRVLRRALWSRNRWLAQPGGLDGRRQQAAELVADGAFDIAIVAVPSSHAILARCLERFATELVRQATGSYPPLNDAPVAMDRAVRAGSAVSHALARTLFSELDRTARG
jgi:hypothetical protein